MSRELPVLANSGGLDPCWSTTAFWRRRYDPLTAGSFSAFCVVAMICH